MLPENRLSTTPIVSPLVVPNPQPSDLVSIQLGGIALNNATQGLSIQRWTLTLQGENVVVTPEIGLPQILFSRPDITELCLAFDQNMHPFVAFVQAGQAKFYWFDTVVNDQIFSDLPVGSTTPRCTLDDHRINQTDRSDIILAYIRDGNFYYRQQRDRYNTEILLYPDINITLVAPKIRYVSMDVNWRLLFELRGVFYG